MAFVCACCDKDLGEVPTAWGFSAPDYWGATGVGGDSFLEDELCCIETPAVDELHFFIRGLIEVPVRGSADPLTYNIWVSLSPANFERAVNRWDDPDRAQEPPYFGWLSNNIPGYPDTIQLKTMVHTRGPGRRPLIELEPTDHPLAREQRDGIEAHRLLAVAEVCGG